MLELEHSYWGLKTKTIYLSEAPFDVDGVDSVDFRYLRDGFKLNDFTCFEDQTIIIDLSKGEDVVWSGMASKCRSDIRKAQREDFEIALNSNCEEFIDLMNRFRASKALDPLPEPQAFMDQICSPLPSYFTLFTAKQGGELVAGVLFIRDNKEMMGMIAASKRLEVEKEKRAIIASVDRLLWWEAIKYGIDQGLDILDMGGYFKGSPQCQKDLTLEGVSEFKRRFGGQVVPRYQYKKDYTYKIKLARLLMKTYRGMGSALHSRAALSYNNGIEQDCQP